MILDFLNEPLPWRNCKDNKADDVRDVKAKCLAEPEKHLWKTTTANLQEVRNIFNSIMKLKYGDRPDYNYIKLQLESLLHTEESRLGIYSTTTTPIQVFYSAEFLEEKEKSRHSF